MAESYTQVAPNSTGNKMRTRSRTISGHVVHEQGVFVAAPETYVALADAVTPAQNKHHITVFNAAGSGKVVKVRKLFPINVQLAAVTGVALRFDMKRVTAASAGTAITPQAMDSNNTALPAGITVRTNGTVTEGALMWPQIVSSEEIAANTSQLIASTLNAMLNNIPEGNEIQELTLREGEGFTAKQITSSTVGSYAWLMVFTVEDV